MGWEHTECPRASSHSFIPTRLGTPLNDCVLGVDTAAAAAAAIVAGVFGRPVRRRDSRSLSAFYSWQLVKVRTGMERLTS